LNLLGFKTRLHYVRGKHDRSKIIGKRGGNPLDKDAMDLFLRSPIYADINNEKWTDGKPVRTVFEGLVSIETFNAANQGKIYIAESGDDITIEKEVSPDHQRNKGIKNPEFAYRRFIGCSKCGKPMYGSASRGYNGTLYPAYHCDKGHYFRVPKDELEATVTEFIRCISLKPEQIDLIVTAVMSEWERREQRVEADMTQLNQQIKELEAEAEATVRKLKMVESETAIKYMEADLMSIERKIHAINIAKQKKTTKTVDMGKIVGRVKYFLENLDKLLLQQIDPVKKAQFFGVFFDRIPTYAEIKTGTENPAKITEVSKLFGLTDLLFPVLVAPPRPRFARALRHARCSAPARDYTGVELAATPTPSSSLGRCPI